MPTIGARLRKWTPLLLLCSVPTSAQPTNETAVAELAYDASIVPSSNSTNAPSPTQSPLQSLVPSHSESTCAFRTINYITHTLPQQCLKTSWSAPTPVASAEGLQGATTPTPWAGIPWILEGFGENGADTQQPGTRLTVGAVQETGSPDSKAVSISSSTEAEPEVETDSPLDNANFLSFEEWKKKNLARAGQSPENVGQGRVASSDTRNRRRPVNINALDSLGEEAEIEIDFGGFGQVEGGNGASGMPSGTQDAADKTRSSEEGDNVAPTSFALSKDAGKTCKERFNYASFDCAATVLKTNAQSKSSSAVLVENKDSYMLNECSAQNKFVIVELCDDILVDTVVLANYEFFSSMFRHFRVSVSDRYPVKMDRWRTLATFEARNSRDIQPFLVTEPQIWARYLRIEFLTHYGNEFYCPISLLRVHGTTMMEQFRREEEEARGDDDFAEPIEAADGEPVKTAAAVTDDGGAIPAAQVPIEPDKSGEPEPKPGIPSDVDSASTSVGTVDTPSLPASTPPQSQNSQRATEEPADSAASSNPSVPPKSYSTANDEQPVQSSSSSHSQSASNVDSTSLAITNQSKSSEPSQPTDSVDTVSSTKSSIKEENSATTAVQSNQNGSASKASTNETSTATAGTSAGKAASNATTNGSQTQSHSRGSSQTQPNVATPTTQESFFKSIHKRLQQLEANSTLSLQYIEEQSRILRDAFIKVEKRQLSKTEKFLDHLNSTVMQELKSYRSMYDQLWQSTILELEGMKERQKAEIGEIGARLTLVADELVWQKRMAVVQSTLLLLCLGLVLFVRSGTLGNQSDIPIVQQLGNKYSQFFDSPPRSPENSGIIRRRRTFRNMWRSDTSAGLSERSGHLSDGVTAVSDAETDGRRSPVQIEFSPPTPMTASAASEPGPSPPQVNGTSATASEDVDTGLLTPMTENGPDPRFDETRRVEVLATQSGPATPRGSRDSRPSWEEVDRAVDKLKAEEHGQGLQPNLDQDVKRQRRKKRSPLRRAESYDGAADDSPNDDGASDLFVAE